MVGAALLVLLTLAVSHWLVEPLAVLTVPLFTFSWLGWGLLALALWLLAGAKA